MSASDPRDGAAAPVQPQQTASQEVKREVVEFVKTVAWFLLLFFLLKSYVIEGYEVQGPSMEPTLINQERILVLKFPHWLSQKSWFSGIDAIKPGDIVVFDSTDEAHKRYVKRVVAEGPKYDVGNTVIASKEGDSPGETVPVQIKTGQLFVNNRRVDETYLPREIGEPFQSTERDEVKLRAGEYYVLGDNRRISKDSRNFGPIDDRRVIGKAILRFWPLSKFGLLN
ncbi:MAG: signal peptidase I [Candidatus Hydrogenedentes bacterium]|nr:signal peptidase I [Candidatus Hydrogenedentota bacterium]